MANSTKKVRISVGKKANPHEGTHLADYLRKEYKKPNIRRGAEKMRVQLAVGRMIRRVLKQQKMSLRELARRMGGSISQAQRLLNDDNVNLETLTKFAMATGKDLKIELH